MHKLVPAMFAGVAVAFLFLTGHLIDYVVGGIWFEALFPLAGGFALTWGFKLDLGETLLLSILAGGLGAFLDAVTDLIGFTYPTPPTMTVALAPYFGDAFFILAFALSGALFALAFTMKKRGKR